MFLELQQRKAKIRQNSFLMAFEISTWTVDVVAMLASASVRGASRKVAHCLIGRVVSTGEDRRERWPWNVIWRLLGKLKLKNLMGRANCAKQVAGLETHFGGAWSEPEHKGG